MKRRIIIATFLTIAMLFTGCQEKNSNTETTTTTASETQSQSTAVTSETTTSAEESTTESTTVEETTTQVAVNTTSVIFVDENATPKQYLTQYLEKAEAFTLPYSAKYTNSTTITFEGAICKDGNDLAETYENLNSDGEQIVVREIEANGNDYYVMDSSKKVAVYSGKLPSVTMLYHEMLDVVALEPSDITANDGAKIYTYNVPFEQDDTMITVYTFYMNKGYLTKLTVYGECVNEAYTFGNISFEKPDASYFLIPSDYEQDENSVGYDWEMIAPWWE